jgi:(R,R)-butanediol dehydrogenase/meso-butanediol dehydrogenase/diacetyl reductase
MRALVLSGPRALAVEEIDGPEDPGAGEVVVAPVLGGICGTDAQFFRDGPRRGEPQILGHEVVASVLAVGAGVESARPGDRVAVTPIVACGRCEMCRSGVGQLCLDHQTLGIWHPWGGLAERALVRESQLVPLPEAITWNQAALIEPFCVASTGVARSGLRPGGRLVIFGGGPIGSLAALGAEAAGAGQILVVEPNADRAERVRGLGFEAVDPTAVDVVGLCRERSAGLGFDAAVDCAGAVAGFAAALDAVKPTGTVAVVAIHHHPVELNLERVLHRGLTIAGAVAYPLQDWGRRAEQIAAGRVEVERVITSRLPLADAPGAVESLAAGSPDDLKVLIEVAAEP